MNYLDKSLDAISSLSLHWSSDCNMACKYCYIEKDKACMAHLNQEIITALQDGSFLANIKKVFCNPELINQIEALSLWGAEPTINGLYFKGFIEDLLDYFPNIKKVMMSTNALVGGEFIYNNFCIPLYEYCENRQRSLNYNIQLSIDGPHEFNDDSRHEGATQSTIDTLFYIIEHMPEESKYLDLSLTSKPTLDISYMRIMNDRGIECFNWYFQFFDKIQQEADRLIHGRKYLNCVFNIGPTLVDPGFHTIDDGKTFAKWIKNLSFVDREKIPTFTNQPLFFQIGDAIAKYLSNDIRPNPIAVGVNCFSCSAGKNDITIDHNGKIYNCNRLAKNTAKPVDEQKFYSMRVNSNLFCSDKRWLMNTWGQSGYHNDIKSRFMMFQGLVITMAEAGQIQKKYLNSLDDRLLLFYACCSMWCHVGNEEDLTQNILLLPTSILKLIGNGALDELIQYCKTGEQRGDFQVWKTVLSM